MSNIRIEFGLSRLQIVVIRHDSLKNRSEKPSIGYERPWIFGQPRDAQRLAVAGFSKALGAVINQRNKVCFARASWADEERVMGTRRLPKPFDMLHERLKDWMAHHKQALKQLRGHCRRGETRN